MDVGISTRRPGEVTRAMAEGLSRHGFSPVPLANEALASLRFAVFHGLERGEDAMRQQLEARGIPWLVIDLGYLGDRSHHYQVGWGRLGWMPSGMMPTHRFCRLGISIVSDRDSQGEWMILGQVADDNQHRMSDVRLRAVYASIVDRIRAGEPGARIVFRGHPSAPQNLVKGLDVSFQIGGEVALTDALKYARACVTVNSTAYYEAAAAGVPVVCDKGAHYAPVCATFDCTGEDPISFPTLRSAAEKAPQFIKASCAQWTCAEMRSGIALDTLMRFCPGAE